MRITVAQFSQEIEAGYHGTGIRISKSTNQPNACVYHSTFTLAISVSR